jgi:hypothetical protein
MWQVWTQAYCPLIEGSDLTIYITTIVMVVVAHVVTCQGSTHYIIRQLAGNL